MTTSIAEGLDAASPSPKLQALDTFDDCLARLLAAQVRITSRVSWPSKKYRRDPVLFFREILGVEPWSKQVEIIEAIRDHKRVAVKSGHKVSKDLANDTPVFTPSGWTTHGALEIGDMVFAPDGSPTRVISTTRYESQEIYRVHFEDGSHIDASATHDWVVRSRELRKPRNAHKPSEKLTTCELYENQRVKNGPGRNIPNWTVDLAKPLKMRARVLPLDPYLLGAWLGDGGTKQAIFTGIDGLEKRFESAGFEITKLKNKPSWYVRGLLPKLRAAGILGNKHVPLEYMQASKRQRLEVLRGLMDTDGTCTKGGRASFTNTNKRLAQDVLTLARTLGQKARIREGRATLDGRDCGPVWTVQWASSLACFALPRKLARLKTKRDNKRNAHKRIAIESIEILEERADTQCIEVDHPSHMYLAGESMIPTHNSHTASGVALWFYCSFEDARTVMTSTTARQVDDILWRELRMMRARCGICVDCKRENESRDIENKIEVPCEHSSWIDGDIGEMARTGLKSHDFREVKGFTAREAEAVAGISGRNLLYILDEASGIKKEIYEAIEGNRAGGARVVLFSNPTRTDGEFFDAFNSKAKFYKTITVSSEDTPNARYGDDDPRAIPGLAGRDWINEKKEEWGEDSALYKVRVKGEFAELEEGKIFSVHTIAEAEARWHDTLGVGRLWIGLDPAGAGPSGDETVWAPRRGLKIGSLVAMRGQSAEAILMHTLGIARAQRHDREIPVVVLDREGMIGAEVYGTFLAYLAGRDTPEFELIAVRASDRAHRNAMVYDRQRDCLVGEFLGFIQDGGAIPSDSKLAKELHAYEWIPVEKTGRVKVTAKKDIRKELGRSPDRFDACALAVWQPLGRHEGDGADLRKNTYEPPTPPSGAMDPYGSTAVIDPYG